MQNSIQTRLSAAMVLVMIFVVCINFFIFEQIHMGVDRIDAVFSSNTAINDLSESLNKLEGTVYEYLNTKGSKALENYYRYEQDYRQLLDGLNDRNVDSEVKMLEKNIRKMSESYLDQTNETVQAKRGRNIEKYKSSYEKELQLYEYINSYIYKLNNLRFRTNSANYQILLSSMDVLYRLALVVIFIVAAVGVVIILLVVRDFFLEIVQNRQIPMKLRLQKILAAASDFQRCLDKNELFKWEDIRQRHKASGFGEGFSNKVKQHINQKDTPEQLFKKMWKTIVPEMEVLRPGWHDFLNKALSALYGKSAPAYLEHKDDFSKAYPDWNIQEEQLLVYWIYTYFCGAVYDEEIFAKIKMAVICTLLIHELDIGTYLKNGRIFCLGDQISICYRFSRELEHSDLNLNALENLLASDKLFSLENMLKIC